jgi:hypothetical protein
MSIVEAVLGKALLLMHKLFIDYCTYLCLEVDLVQFRLGVRA